MNLSKSISEQYKRREGKETLYSDSPYTREVREELLRKMTSLFKRHFGDTDKLTILEIGAGDGGNVPLFLKLGFKRENIALNELLPQRILNIKKNHPDITLFEGDATGINFNNSHFDIVFQSTVFTSILNQKNRELLAQKMWSLTKSGGGVLWYDFIYNNPKNPDVKKVSKKEVICLFSEAVTYDIIKVTLAPPVGRRVGNLYKYFNVSPLRSHILALFRKA